MWGVQLVNFGDSRAEWTFDNNNHTMFTTGQESLLLRHSSSISGRYDFWFITVTFTDCFHSRPRYFTFTKCCHMLVILFSRILSNAIVTLMLCGLSFERYLGVLHPLLHRKQVTKERFKKYLCFAILFSAFCISTTLFGDKNYTLPTVVFVISILFCFLFYLFVYTRIFVRVKDTLNPEGQKRRVFPVEATQTNTSRIMWKRRFIKEFKLAKSCFLVVCTFGLCFLPSVILFTPLNLDKDANLIAWSWAIFLAGLNCCLNSMIFFWSKKVLRKEAKKILMKCCGCH